MRDDAILRDVEVPFEGSKDVCEVVHIAGDADETSEAALQDIMCWRGEGVQVSSLSSAAEQRRFAMTIV